MPISLELGNGTYAKYYTVWLLYLDLGEVYNNIWKDVVLWVTNLVQHLFPNCSQADHTAYKTLLVTVNVKVLFDACIYFPIITTKTKQTLCSLSFFALTKLRLYWDRG